MDKRTEQIGILSILTSQVLWGLSPFYWRLIGQVGGLETICYRILFALGFTLILIALSRRGKEGKWLPKPKYLGLSALSAALLVVNWYIYVAAVNSGRVQEGSFGYFINPIMLVVAGMIFFKEKLSRGEKRAFVLVLAGLAMAMVAKGKISFVVISLPVTFVCYSCLQKKNPMPALQGFAVEMLFMAPLAIGYLIYTFATGASTVTGGPGWLPWVLPIAGAVTALPMLFFNNGINKVNMVLAGFLQYLSPIIQLLLSIFAFHEPFSWLDATSFVLVWIGIMFITVEKVKEMKKLKQENA